MAQNENNDIFVGYKSNINLIKIKRERGYDVIAPTALSHILCLMVLPVAGPHWMAVIYLDTGGDIPLWGLVLMGLAAFLMMWICGGALKYVCERPKLILDSAGQKLVFEKGFRRRTQTELKGADAAALETRTGYVSMDDAAPHPVYILTAFLKDGGKRRLCVSPDRDLIRDIGTRTAATLNTDFRDTAAKDSGDFHVRAEKMLGKSYLAQE